MTANIVLIAFALFLILGGFMGLRRGSKISFIMGSVSGLLVLAGLWLTTFNPHLGWMSLSGLGILLSSSFVSRLAQTRKFMPSGMLLLITVGFLVFCWVQLR